MSAMVFTQQSSTGQTVGKQLINYSAKIYNHHGYSYKSLTQDLAGH